MVQHLMGAAETTGIDRKLAALEIIFAAPLWPKRANLPDAGQVLFDLITGEAKEYALHLVDGDFPAALAILGRWGDAMNRFIDTTRIAGNDPAERMVSVFLHYGRAFGADFAAIIQ